MYLFHIANKRSVRGQVKNKYICLSCNNKQIKETLLEDSCNLLHPTQGESSAGP